MTTSKRTWTVGLLVIFAAVGSLGCSDNDSGNNPDGGSQTKFHSGNLVSGASYVFTFTVAEAVPYHCNLHLNMNGTITVNAATGATDTVNASIPNSITLPSLTITAGQSVRWTNNDVTAHTVTSDSQ